MQQVTIEPNFPAWRTRARELLVSGIEPAETFWSDGFGGQSDLFPELVVKEIEPRQSNDKSPSDFRIPKAFLDLAETVSCHRDESRWGLLYRILWRIARRGERHLLGLPTDADIRKANTLAKEVRRDCHKMRAFVRFRKVAENEENGREQFVAWFEPMHHIVRYNASFFQKRFTGMDWSILTPDECAHWDGLKLQFSQGVEKSAAPTDDALEEVWRSYYQNIFNPVRLKLKAMQSEMPVKYWKNLPEATLIQDLTAGASMKQEEMIEREPLPLRAAPKNLYLRSLNEMNEVALVSEAGAEDSIPLAEMRKSAHSCRACPLWENATQTIFGEGNEAADIMLIGEQPGDEEDISGMPFVGPAGQLLEEILAEAELDREQIYLTNAVKHFKWKPGGKQRLHDKANRAEMKACRPWLLGEIARVSPRVIVTVGNTAAQSVIDPSFKITTQRGLVEWPNQIEFKGPVVATIHPSFLLRMRDRSERDKNTKLMVEELRLVRTLASKASQRVKVIY
ncbi:UdgX family uracil-DNA binding protein [Verrucomicrobiales bacterium]|nr:UdgX family uracil-DNA binding protein [Verrucomicrobiales bacterium]